MANCMKEVANMLGVELGEKFYINNNTEATFYFTWHGLGCDGNYHSANLSFLLECLLNGYVDIQRKPWKPSYRESYYVVAKTGIVMSNIWYDHAFDLMAHKLGNCYRTKEEAEVNRDKWIAFYASDEILEV